MKKRLLGILMALAVATPAQYKAVMGTNPSHFNTFVASYYL